ncbi:unnamed protein product [Closterium sp. Naga37s-1]|nr:unnamed protein product [Closterium sp. Naga37s-1]
MILGDLERNCSECSAWPHTPTSANSPPPRTPPQDSTSGTWSAWDLSPRGWGEVQSELRAETPSTGQGHGQTGIAERRSPGPVEGCGTAPSLIARTDTLSKSVRAWDPPGQEPGRREALWLRRCVCEPAPLLPAPAAPPLPKRSLPLRQRSPDCGCYRRARGHSANRDGLQIQPTADVAGTARGEQNPSGAQEIPSPASPEIAAESVARGIALAANAYFDPRAQQDDAEESGDGGSDAALEIAGRLLRYEEVRVAQDNSDEEIAAAESDAAGNVRAPDPAGQRGGLTRPEQKPTSTPARWAVGLPEEEERARAQSGGRAHLRRGARGHMDEERQAPALAARSPLYPPTQDRDPRSDPLRPIPLPPTPAQRQRVSDVAADPPTRRAGAARGRETRGIRVGRGSIRSGRGRGATTQRRGASSFARAAQRVLRQRAREGGETLGDDSGNGSAGDPSFIPEREGSSSPSTGEEEVDPAQGVGEIPTGGRTASAIRTPRNRAARGTRAARGNRAATNTGVTTTPDTPAPIVSADDLAGRQDLFADIANWDLCPLRDSRQPPLARHPPRPLRESFAICLLTPLLHLAKNPDSSPGWKLLMFLPRILLRSSSARKPDWKAMGDKLTRFCQGLWRDLYDEATDAVTNNPQPRHVPDTTGKLARAEGLAKRGNLAKSLQSLTATPVCTPSAEVLSALTGGTRPIAVGECLLRLIAKAALFLAALAAHEHFIPLQFGVVIAGGIEAAIHTARTYLEEFPGATALQIDLANAFHAVERAAVFEGLKGTALNFLVPLVRLSYVRSSALYLDHDFGAEPLQSARGCEAWSATALDPATLPPGIKISLDGVRVLGSPIGPPTGCAARVRERLSAAAEPLPLLSQMDPQLCLLLLTRYVSRRASFLVRATPLEALPLGEWSAWGEDLLHTYLAATHTTIPKDWAERDRIWQQAALPASLGGLGITNPAVEGGFAYLASYVSAAHLLRSFGDSANPALTGLLPLMDADGESTSLLPRRLAALEAELPPAGTEALQVGRQKPNGPKLQ